MPTSRKTGREVWHPAIFLAVILSAASALRRRAFAESKDLLSACAKFDVSRNFNPHTVDGREPETPCYS